MRLENCVESIDVLVKGTPYGPFLGFNFSNPFFFNTGRSFLRVSGPRCAYGPFLGIFLSGGMFLGFRLLFFSNASSNVFMFFRVLSVSIFLTNSVFRFRFSLILLIFSNILLLHSITSLSVVSLDRSFLTSCLYLLLFIIFVEVKNGISIVYCPFFSNSSTTQSQREDPKYR